MKSGRFIEWWSRRFVRFPRVYGSWCHEGNLRRRSQFLGHIGVSERVFLSAGNLEIKQGRKVEDRKTYAVFEHGHRRWQQSGKTRKIREIFHLERIQHRAVVLVYFCFWMKYFTAVAVVQIMTWIFGLNSSAFGRNNVTPCRGCKIASEMQFSIKIWRKYFFQILLISPCDQKNTQCFQYFSIEN